MHMHCFVFIYFCVQLVHYVLVVIMQGVACTPQDARAEEPQTTDWFAKIRQSDIGHMYFCKRCAETIEKRKEEKKVDVSAPWRCTQNIILYRRSELFWLVFGQPIAQATSSHPHGGELPSNRKIQAMS